MEREEAKAKEKAREDLARAATQATAAMETMPTTSSPSLLQRSDAAAGAPPPDSIFAARPVPALTGAGLPPHLRVMAAAKYWQELGDKYVGSIAQHGLLLSWVEGFNPLNFSEEFCPRWCQTKHPLPYETGRVVQQWLDSGVIQEISSNEALCCSPIFTIEKKGSEELRLITNLKNVNAFLQTTHFHLPTLQTITPLLTKGMW